MDNFRGSMIFFSKVHKRMDSSFCSEGAFESILWTDKKVVLRWEKKYWSPRESEAGGTQWKWPQKVLNGRTFAYYAGAA